MATLNGCYAKLYRAEDHLRDFDALWKRGVDSGRYLSSREDEKGEVVYEVSFPEAEALAFGVRIGDVVHNLRSALDHLIWQLVLANGETPGAWNQFPLVRSKGSFPPKGRGGHSFIEGIGAEASRYIERAQRYIGNESDWDYPLWTIVNLSNADKHRVVTPVGQAFRKPTVTWQEAIGGTQMGITITSRHPGDSTRAARGPLEDGAEIFRRTPAQIEKDMKYSITQELAFQEGSGLKGRYVSIVLSKASSEVRNLLDGAAPLMVSD